MLFFKGVAGGLKRFKFPSTCYFKGPFSKKIVGEAGETSFCVRAVRGLFKGFLSFLKAFFKAVVLTQFFVFFA